MIKINKIIIIYPLLPILFLLFLRFMFFIAGATWMDPQTYAVISTMVGLSTAVLINIIVEDRDTTSWGHWKIGKDID